jgi:hypothetical protein
VSINQFNIAVAKVLYTELTGLFTVYAAGGKPSCQDYSSHFEVADCSSRFEITDCSSQFEITDCSSQFEVTDCSVHQSKLRLIPMLV